MEEDGKTDTTAGRSRSGGETPSGPQEASAQSPSATGHSSSKKCGNCREKLPKSYTKPFCYKCINILAGKEAAAMMKSFLSSMQTEMLATVKAFREAAGQSAQTETEELTPKEGTSSQETPFSKGPSVFFTPSQNPPLGEADGEESEVASLPRSRHSSGEVDGDSISQSQEDTRPRKHLFAVEDLESLLQAIYATEEIPETPKPTSAQDKVYRGLSDAQSKVFPLHKSLKELVLQEWRDPERRIIKQKTWKRRFPFSQEDEEVFFKLPRLDAALSQVTKLSDLSFEDAGNIKDVMDRRAESLLRKAWEANAAALSPALAAACVARNTDVWVETLTDHLAQNSEAEEVVESLTVVRKAIAYLADAATESARAAAKTAALINSTRRAVWIKAWEGDATSKGKLCGIPFQGSLLFGKDLDDVLARSSEKGKKFPVKPKKEGFKKTFRGPQGQGRQKAKKEPFRRWNFGKGNRKNNLLFPPPKPSDKPSK